MASGLSGLLYGKVGSLTLFEHWDGILDYQGYYIEKQGLWCHSRGELRARKRTVINVIRVLN